MDDKHIEGNIYLIYSSDEGTYYFEDRNPDQWRLSSDVFDTEDEAMEYFDADEINWKDF